MFKNVVAGPRDILLRDFDGDPCTAAADTCDGIDTVRISRDVFERLFPRRRQRFTCGIPSTVLDDARGIPVSTDPFFFEGWISVRQ